MSASPRCSTRIVGRRISPLCTTNRASPATASWPKLEMARRARSIHVVDTGGIGLLRREKADDVITKAALEQVNLAMDAAGVIILVVNVQEGIVPLDREVAQRLRQSGKPVLVAVNKLDTARAEPGVDEFTGLGFDKIFPVTAIHGEGIEVLMDAAFALLPALAED